MLALIVCQLPAVSLAAGPDTVWVGEVELASGEYTENGTTVGTGSATLSSASYNNGVLTLSNFHYSGAGHTLGDGSSAAIYADGSITLNLRYTNSLTTDAGAATRYGVYVAGRLTVASDGKLTVSAGNSSAGSSIGIYAATSVITKVCTLDCSAGAAPNGSSCGINAPLLSVTGGTLRSNGGSAGTASLGVDSAAIALDNSDVRLTGGSICSSEPDVSDYTSYVWRTVKNGVWSANDNTPYQYSASQTFFEIMPGICMDFTDTHATWGGLQDVDLTARDASGSGWAWDAGEKTLTLSGLSFSTAAAVAMRLPDGATVVTNDGTTNSVVSTFSRASFTCGIYGVGSLTFAGGGTLNVTGGTAASSLSAD